MIAQQVASRYALALYNIDTSTEALESRLKVLQEIVEFISGSIQLSYFFSSPQIGHDEKAALLTNSFKGKIDAVILHFLLLLLDKGRFNYLPEIVEAYKNLLIKHIDTMEVQVITVIPLDDKGRTDLIKKLHDYYKKEIVLIEKIDPSILGGVILIVDNVMVDSSIKNKLTNLKEKLLAVKV